MVRIGATEPEDAVGRVVVTVEDEGTGIPAELLPRIFEPQFSTRSTGSGLGLAIAKRLVDSWEGVLEVESEVGRGTRASIRLRVRPAWRKPAGEEDGHSGDGDAVAIE